MKKLLLVFMFLLGSLYAEELKVGQVWEYTSCVDKTSNKNIVLKVKKGMITYRNIETQQEYEESKGYFLVGSRLVKVAYYKK